VDEVVVEVTLGDETLVGLVVGEVVGGVTDEVALYLGQLPMKHRRRPSQGLPAKRTGEALEA